MRQSRFRSFHTSPRRPVAACPLVAVILWTLVMKCLQTNYGGSLSVTACRYRWELIMWMIGALSVEHGVDNPRQLVGDMRPCD
jgi:hypothetical protein